MSIDDFGATDTSLVHLRTVPAAQIKIAETFTAGVDDNPQDRAVIESLVHLARTLGCRVSAKGVVSRSTADWLKNAGCDHGQGDLWARPSPWTGLVGRFTDLALPSPRTPIASPVNPDLTPGVTS
jgi:EAL domain-containing protein (putative c-di-GMP-specific phosphodiesterase class I)